MEVDAAVRAGSGLDVHHQFEVLEIVVADRSVVCLLYTSDAADERSSVDLGGRRIIKKKKRSES